LNCIDRASGKKPRTIGSEDDMCNPKHWKYCDKCKRAVIYEPDPFEMPDTISRELKIRMEEHQLNLCRTCRKDFAACNGKPEFGQCVGEDNVINCPAHEQAEQPQW